MPKRIQLSRRKGSRLPEGTVNVARPTKWGNPYKLTDYAEWYHRDEWQALAVSDFKSMVTGSLIVGGRHAHHYPSIETIRHELAGLDLACWCKLGLPCHANVLLQIANGVAMSAIDSRQIGVADEVREGPNG